jgi:tRNA-2-methylthio-N6-dimethylallyladenosine synthase
MKAKIFIETYGCQMNVSDTELITSILQKASYQIVDCLQTADIVLLNTCTVRDNADRKELNKVQKIKYDYPEMIVGILGCMASGKKEELLEKKYKVDLVVGPDKYRELPQIINTVIDKEERAGSFSLDEFETYADIEPSRASGYRAWVPIMRGCNNFCSYCIVPYVRGRERSQDHKSIITEIEKLVEQGYKEVNLLGQNVNSYNDGNLDFVKLLEKISNIQGLLRIRFISPHPKDLSLDLIHLMANRENICKYLHLPLQAGSSRILKLMNRTYTKEQYLELVQNIKTIIPKIVLTTDIIIGFSTETAADYQDTIDVMNQVQFSSAYIFKYSERSGTQAAREYKDDVPEQEKTKRIVNLNKIQNDISLKNNKSFVGEVQEIIVEQKGTKKNEKEYQGRNDANKIVIFSGNSLQEGDLVKVKINSATVNVLKGVITNY